ncbi:MAG: murein biosynthesis integral membrane protein MurJ [Chloroflexota bacterium]
MSDITEQENRTPDASTRDQNLSGIGRSASLISMGNIAGRILGLVREMIIARYFGATGEVSAFRTASQVPTALYDLLVGGMLSAALVPTLNEYTSLEHRKTFARLVSSLLILFALALALITITLEFFAPQIAQWLAPGFRVNTPHLLILTIRLLRIAVPTVWFISMAGVVMGILYAQERFTFPAMAAAIFNLGIVVTTPLLASSLGILSLAVGMLIGSIAQLIFMGWDLVRFLYQENLLSSLRPSNHPALSKILHLYLPIASVTLFSTGQIALDRRLANSTGELSVAWMQYATTLQQLPLGLISIAISLASLPRLSHYFTIQDQKKYRQTLSTGLRLVLLLIVPAAAILWILGEPIIRLIFEHQSSIFAPEDTARVFPALRIYAIGMIFAAIDNPLNYAFYARNNTLLPAIVGVISILVYVITAFTLLNTMGYLALVWADTIKHSSHMLLMILALYWQIGRLQAGLCISWSKILGAGAGMAVVVWATYHLFQFYIFPSYNLAYDNMTTQNFTKSPTFLVDLLILSGSAGLGLSAYIMLLYWFGVRDFATLVASLRKKSNI